MLPEESKFPVQVKVINQHQFVPFLHIFASSDFQANTL
jgi:hypothetical protein